MFGDLLSLVICTGYIIKRKMKMIMNDEAGVKEWDMH